MTAERTARRRTRKAACPTCDGEGQVEATVVLGRGRNAVHVNTWALCLDCCGTDTAKEPTT